MVNPTIFRQYDIRGVVDKDLSNETLYLIGKGYGSYMRRLGGKTVVIGGDMRLSTPSFKKNFIKGNKARNVFHLSKNRGADKTETGGRRSKNRR